DEGRALAHLDGHLRYGPAADLRARHLRQPVERRQLGVMVATVLSRLTDPGRHASLLQAEHRWIGLLGARPPTNQGIERILVRQAPSEIDEPAILCPLWVSRDCC